MPYPSGILTMAQNMIHITGLDPYVHENKFYMLWNAILNIHFPITRGYGVEPETETGFLIVKTLKEEESPVLLVRMKAPVDDTPTGRESIAEELAEYMNTYLDEYQYSTIYGIGGVGLSFAVYKMESSGMEWSAQFVFDWASNVTAVGSFDRMKRLASMVDEMTDAKGVECLPEISRVVAFGPN